MPPLDHGPLAQCAQIQVVVSGISSRTSSSSRVMVRSETSGSSSCRVVCPVSTTCCTWRY
jgi:hypothetical protein